MASAADLAPVRSKRARQRLETRELLYQCALAEFRRTGSAQARVRDIVAAAGVVPGTFYFHFPTREHVIFELWLRNAARLAERLPPPDAPLPRFLHALGDAMIDVEQELGDPRLVRDSIGIVLRPPEGVDLAANPIRPHILRLFEAARARGELRSELGPEALASVLLTSVLGVLASAGDDPAERRRDLRRTLDFFLRALR